MGKKPADRVKALLGKLAVVHRRDAEGAESYLFLLSAERPESKRTQPLEADKNKPFHNSSFSLAYS